MQKTTKHAIAGLLSAAGAFFTAFAAEFGEGSETAETPAPKTRKPRNSATATAPAEQTTTAAAEVTETPESTSTEPQGKTYEELKALIKPHVEGGKGPEVKDIIKKYSATGLKDMKAEHHEAFEKDLETLSY